MKSKIFVLIFACALIATLGIPALILGHSWKAPKKASQWTNPVSKTQDSIERGKVLYRKLCVACHGKSGQGDGPLANKLRPEPPDLIERSAHHSDGDFAWKIKNGRGAMPAFKDQLSENEIWDLINFLKRKQSP